MELSPEQFSSLKRVLAEPAAKLNLITGVPVAEIEGFLGRIEKIANKCTTALGSNRLLLIHDPAAKGRPSLDAAGVAAMIRTGSQQVNVGSDLSVVSSQKGTVSLTDAAAQSERGPRIVALLTAGHFTVFAGGKPVAEIGCHPPSQHGRSDWRRSWRDLRLAMDDHFKHCIEDEKNVRYWSDKRKRILLQGADGTEKIFHQSLFWWLRHMLSDAFEVYGETLGMGQIKTDISIVTEVGIIAVEVKWMGKNEKNTAYDEIAIRKGLEQVAIYLSKYDRIFGAYVVLYDARPEDVHKAECRYPSTCVAEKCETPVIYFLPSETPSQVASKVAAS